MNFLHSGDAGDLIYSLPAIKALKGADVLYLNIDNPNRCTLQDGSVTLFTKEKIKTLVPLLEVINYIKEIKIYTNEVINYNLDIFRTFVLERTNICRAYLKALNLDENLRNETWLKINSKPSEEVVISRSLRYRNPRVDWDKIYRFVVNRCAFVGTKEEHKDFEEKIGKIKFLKANNLLQVAEYIAGCNIFIGNQSAPYAIAEGLKKNSIQEVCLFCPNCIFDRPNAFYLWDNKTADYLKQWELNLKHVT